MLTDEELAQNVKGAVRILNEAIYLAEVKGLHVSIEKYDLALVTDTSERFYAKVYRKL